MSIWTPVDLFGPHPPPPSTVINIESHGTDDRGPRAYYDQLGKLVHCAPFPDRGIESGSNVTV